MSALTAISLVGAGFGTWLGLPLLWSTGASARTGRLLGGLLTMSAVVTAVVVFDHANYLGPTRWLEPVDYNLTLVVGPLLLFYVRRNLIRVTGISPKLQTRWAWSAAYACSSRRASAVTLNHA